MLLVALEVFLQRIARLLAIAVVRFIVDRQNILHAHQLGHDTLEHLPLGFDRVESLPSPLEERSTTLRQIDALTQLEGVVVRDDDLRALQIGEHVARHQLATLVIAVRVVRLQHAQAISNRQPRRHDEETSGESLALRMSHGIDRLPCDQHCHHGGFAGARRELQRHPHELRIGVIVGVGQVLEKPLAGVSRMRCHFGKPDRGFYGLHLAEERANATELVVSPVLQ